MDAVLRAVAMYLILLVLFRLAGKRSMTQATSFDFVLLLMVSEATQQALLGQDFSFAKAATVITTLVGLDRLADYFSFRFPKFGKALQSVPVILVENGELLQDRMDKAHVDESDILTFARQSQGLESLDQVKYAILEKNGGISIVPRG